MVKNITLSADEQLIRKAREKAAREERTLNQLFREWLARYVASDDAVENYRELMRQLAHVRADRTFTRDEMNERR
jgi:hemerythrin